MGSLVAALASIGFTGGCTGRSMPVSQAAGRPAGTGRVLASGHDRRTDDRDAAVRGHRRDRRLRPRARLRGDLPADPAAIRISRSAARTSTCTTSRWPASGRRTPTGPAAWSHRTRNCSSTPSRSVCGTGTGGCRWPATPGSPDRAAGRTPTGSPASAWSTRPGTGSGCSRRTPIPSPPDPGDGSPAPSRTPSSSAIPTATSTRRPRSSGGAVRRHSDSAPPAELIEALAYLLELCVRRGDADGAREVLDRIDALDLSDADRSAAATALGSVGELRAVAQDLDAGSQRP